MLLKLWCKEKPLTKFMLPLTLFVKTCSTELQLLKDLIYRISLHSILKILIEKNIFRRIRVMLFWISCSLDLVCLVLMYSQFILFLLYPTWSFMTVKRCRFFVTVKNFSFSQQIFVSVTSFKSFFFGQIISSWH